MKILSNKEFIAAYPVGARIIWQNRKSEEWFPGVVVEPERKTSFEPCVWFTLDKDTDGISRYVSHDYQNLLKREA